MALVSADDSAALIEALHERAVRLTHHRLTDTEGVSAPGGRRAGAAGEDARDVSRGTLKAGDRRVLREARTEAVFALALDAALLLASRWWTRRSWSIVDLSWWAWLLLAAPALALMTVLLIAPVAELRPGRVRNTGIALSGCWSPPTWWPSACSSSRSRPAARTASAPATWSRTGRSSG